MQSAEDIAKAKAQASAREAIEQEQVNGVQDDEKIVNIKPNQENISNTVGLTSFEELTKDYQTNIAKTPSGYTFIIQSIVPGDFVRLIGTPIIDLLLEKDIDINTPDSVAEGIKSLSEKEQMGIVASDSFIEMAKLVICAGVISINFTVKKQDECDSAKKEVSIDRLSLADVISLYTQIMSLSMPEAQIETVRLFRTDEQAEQEQSDKDTQDS